MENKLLTICFDLIEFIGLVSVLVFVMTFVNNWADKLNPGISFMIIIFSFATFIPVINIATFLREKYLTIKT